MPKNSNNNLTHWVEGDLRLVGTLDKRMIGLLSAIKQCGSINQAAKQVGLSYKGAWQMIERANNLAPKVLIATATGGSKGGGTSLTAAGLALVQLFDELEQAHQQFLCQLNQHLAENSDMQLLLKRLVIKTSATNQLFGTIARIEIGAVTAEVCVALKDGAEMIVSLAMTELTTLNLTLADEVVLLINDSEMMLMTEIVDAQILSARNCVSGTVIRIQHDGADAVLVMQLPSGETLMATTSKASAEVLALKLGDRVHAVFKSNAVIVGVLS